MWWSLKSTSSKYPSFKVRSKSNEQMYIVIINNYNQEHCIVVIYSWLLSGTVVPRLQKRETSVDRHGEGTGNSQGIFHSACQLNSLCWGHLVCMDWWKPTISTSHWQGLQYTRKKQQRVTRFFIKQTSFLLMTSSSLFKGEITNPSWLWGPFEKYQRQWDWKNDTEKLFLGRGINQALGRLNTWLR